MFINNDRTVTSQIYYSGNGNVTTILINTVASTLLENWYIIMATTKICVNISTLWYRIFIYKIRYHSNFHNIVFLFTKYRIFICKIRYDSNYHKCNFGNVAARMIDVWIKTRLIS